MVSIVTIFFNEERFLQEAITSIYKQDFDSWELLLVDDGSQDASSDIARAAARAHPHRVRYFEHANHVNLGMSASRNLALAHARGTYLAFLDADDIWESTKLSAQTAVLQGAPHLGMTYCATKYWYGWTGQEIDSERDHLYLPVNRAIELAPPHTLTELMKGSIRVPCMGSVLTKRNVLQQCGGWENSFRGLYEDQVMISKVLMTTPVRVTTDCHDRYRQHDDSCCTIAYRDGIDAKYHRQYIRWLYGYVTSHPNTDEALLSLVKKKFERAN
ncbi:MAG: glycosyltransferase family 2 protein [Prochlorococcaceae cyanobacterium]